MQFPIRAELEKTAFFFIIEWNSLKSHIEQENHEKEQWQGDLPYLLSEPTLKSP